MPARVVSLAVLALVLTSIHTLAAAQADRRGESLYYPNYPYYAPGGYGRAPVAAAPSPPRIEPVRNLDQNPEAQAAGRSGPTVEGASPSGRETAPPVPIASRPAPPMEPTAGDSATRDKPEERGAPASPGLRFPAGFGIEPTRLGSVLAARGGRTLYVAVASGRDDAPCGKGCKQRWLPLHLAPDDRAFAPFGAVATADGKLQWTYQDHPLFLWNGDQHPGDVTGDGVDGRWFAVRVDGARAP